MLKTTKSKKAQKKYDQLGMPIGTAANRLRKSILFSLVCKLNLNFCFQCNEQITEAESLSVEHKTPYLDSENPVEAYFDLDNIAFSHNGCNSGARRSRPVYHGTSTMYIDYKCRCAECLKYRRDRYKNNGT